MIIRVWSDLSTFREVSFTPAMNVVLADRGEDSDENESTNGLGKTTLLRIIQFCLGSELVRDKVLRHPALKGVLFGLDLQIKGEAGRVCRNTGSPEIVYVSGVIAKGDALGDVESPVGFKSMAIDDFRDMLSRILLRESGDVGGRAPSFRDLSHYFIRIGKGAFVDPQSAYPNQSGPSKRSAVTYLLNLNYGVQHDLHSLLKERSSVQAASQALLDAGEANNDGTIGELEAERVVLESAVKDRRSQAESFNIRGDYHELEARLTSVDQSIHELLNDNHSDRKLLEYYLKSSKEMPPADAQEPIALLREAGAIFSADALRTLDEVAEFHRQIYANRKEFLLSEVQRLRARISARTAMIDRKASDKSEVLRLLSSSGALETLIELQRGATELASKLEALKARIGERKRFDRRKDELTAKIAATRSLLKLDLEDRRSGVDEAIALFADYTACLYGVPGKLSVDIKDSGYRYTFTIDRQGSDGVDQMVVFCFDLMIATLRARREEAFVTLIHDSTLFADVDPRQYGLALQLAAAVADAEGFQYICCLNSGALPLEHLGSLTLDSLVRLRLTDDSEAGQLLGRRLPPQDH